MLSEAGSVVDAFLPADRATGRPRGFAFVTFSGETEAAEAIRLFNGREVDGRKLTVNAADDRPGQPGRPRTEGSAGPPPRSGAFGGGDRLSRERPVKRKGSRRGLRARKRSL